MSCSCGPGIPREMGKGCREAPGFMSTLGSHWFVTGRKPLPSVLEESCRSCLVIRVLVPDRPPWLCGRSPLSFLGLTFLHLHNEQGSNRCARNLNSPYSCLNLFLSEKISIYIHQILKRKRTSRGLPICPSVCLFIKRF